MEYLDLMNKAVCRPRILYALYNTFLASLIIPHLQLGPLTAQIGVITN